MDQDSVHAAGVGRSHNTVFVVPPDASRAATFLAPALDRLDPDAAGPQLLIIVTDPDTAVTVARAVTAIGGPRRLRATAATSARRAARALAARPSAVVVGDAATLLALVGASALKLGGLREVIVAWPEDVLAASDAALETLLAEAPKEAARTIVVREIVPPIEALIERHARRARRVVPASEGPVPAFPLSYVVVHDATRALHLREVLDALDPPSAFVYARAGDDATAVGGLLDALGYASDGPVTTGETMQADADALVFYDFPATRIEIERILGGRRVRRAVALVLPHQLSALRDLVGTAAVPLVLPDAIRRARTAEDRMRDELREALASGAFGHELLALEPLLGDFDGIEIAAAALRLLEAERRRPPAQAEASPRMTRLFVSAGEMDGVRAGDLVGAVADAGGLSGREIGRVEMHERHALVEVPEAVAEAVAGRLTGTTIRGRQIRARLERDRPARPQRTPRASSQRRRAGDEGR